MAEPDISLDIEELIDNPFASVQFKHKHSGGRDRTWRSWIQEDMQVDVSANIVSGATARSGVQLEAGVKAQGSS